MRRLLGISLSGAILSAAMTLIAIPAVTGATTCSPTGFTGLTAARIGGSVSGTVNATGCDIGVYYAAGTPKGNVKNAEVYGALYYGVVVNGDNGPVSSVDVLNSRIHDIGDSPLNGNQRGVGIYYRGFIGAVSGKVSGNTIGNYQKGGIVANGANANVNISDNTVTGQGPVAYIAQNGIQVGYGASAQVMRNTVTGNSYTGTSTVSGGIIVVGGPGYGICPDGNPCAYTTGTQITGNTVVNNDIGVFLTNLDASGDPPTSDTNVKVVNNTISNAGLTNNYGSFGYQAGVSDVGQNDKIINNSISGPGYDPNANPTAYTVAVDADASFTNNAKVHANKVD